MRTEPQSASDVDPISPLKTGGTNSGQQPLADWAITPHSWCSRNRVTSAWRECVRVRVCVCVFVCVHYRQIPHRAWGGRRSETKLHSQPAQNLVPNQEAIERARKRCRLATPGCQWFRCNARTRLSWPASGTRCLPAFAALLSTSRAHSADLNGAMG